MNLADKTIINVLAKSGGSVLLLISSVVMVRYLSKNEYGVYLQIILIMNTAVMFAYCGIPQSIYYYFHKTNNKPLFIFQNYAIALILGSVTAICVFSINDYLARWFNNPLLHEYKALISFLIFFRAPTNMREPLLISKGNLVLNSVVHIMSSALFYIPITIAAFFSVGLLFLVKIFLIASIVDFILFLGLIVWLIGNTKRENNPTGNNVVRVSLFKQIRYALPITFSSYMGIIGHQIDKYIVSVFFNPTTFAVYSRGSMRIPVLSQIHYTVNDIMMPQYVKDYADGNIDCLLSKYHLCIKKVAMLNFPVFVFLFFVSPALISLLYTEQYLGAVPVFRTYLLLLVLNITTYGIIPRASGKTQSILYASILNISANIILSCLLVPVLGAVGAAIATILCMSLTCCYYLFISCKILNIGMKRIFPWKFLFSFMGVSMLAGLPVSCIDYLFSLFDVPLWFVLFSEGLVYLYGFICLVMRFDLFTADDLSVLSKWLKIDAYRLFKRLAFL